MSKILKIVEYNTIPLLPLGSNTIAKPSIYVANNVIKELTSCNALYSSNDTISNVRNREFNRVYVNLNGFLSKLVFICNWWRKASGVFISTFCPFFRYSLRNMTTFFRKIMKCSALRILPIYIVVHMWLGVYMYSISLIICAYVYTLCVQYKIKQSLSIGMYSI